MIDLERANIDYPVASLFERTEFVSSSYRARGKGWLARTVPP